VAGGPAEQRDLPLQQALHHDLPGVGSDAGRGQAAGEQRHAERERGAAADEPGQLGGVSVPNSLTLSSGIVDGISDVQIGPGATLFTRIPRSPSSCARLAVKLAIAAFVAAYGASVGDGLSEFTDELPMIADPGFMCGTAALHRWNIAEMFVANV
jgi:hypothetical protein